MTRVISGVVLAAAFLVLIWFGTPTVLLLVAIAVGALAFHEYDVLMRRLDVPVPRWPALLATLAVIAAVALDGARAAGAIALGTVVIAAAGILELARSRADATPRPARAGARDANGHDTQASPAVFARALAGIVSGAFATVYLGATLGALVAIYGDAGRGAVLLLIATIVVSDSAQYYTGRLLGRRRLAPRLSPKKTVEGALGGLVAGPLVAYFGASWLMPVGVHWSFAALGVALVVCGIAGDLFESMIKRAADVKDSSTLIPGHGGVLDRIDALLFATPAFYVYLRWMDFGA